MTNPLVSVVIPTYNQALFLNNAISSLLEQSWRNWEAIIIDNSSTDNTLEIIDEFNDARIRVYKINNDGVIAASRNLGILRARGEFISFLDSDDYWAPLKLERTLEFLAKGFDLVCHAEIWEFRGGQSIVKSYGPSSRSTYKSLLFWGNRLSTSAVSVRRDVVIEIGMFDENPDYKMVEDYDLWMRAAKHGCKFGFIDDVLGTYLVHGHNTSKAYFRHFLAEVRLINAHVKSFNQSSLLIKFLHYSRVVRALASYLFRLSQPFKGPFSKYLVLSRLRL